MSDLNKTTYLPEEMAEEIQGLKEYIGSGGGLIGGDNLDEVYFGDKTLPEIRATLTNPGLTDPKHYEDIAEAINALIPDNMYVPTEDEDKDFTLTVRTIHTPGTYYAKDDGVTAYSKVIVELTDESDSLEAQIIEGTVEEIIDYDCVVHSIASSAFRYLPSLRYVEFPVCTAIGSNAFYQAKLQSFSFPACKTIGSYGFYNCTNLSQAFLPVCTSIGGLTFKACRRLGAIIIPSCQIMPADAFAECNQLNYIDITNCVSIGTSAFANCWALSLICAPACVSINSSAFQSCKALLEAHFPSCTYIGSSAFYDCLSLQTIEFPMCETIAPYAFCNCQELVSVSFPSCLTISTYAFQSCYNLLSLYLLGSSLCALSSTDAFISTPISNYTLSTSGQYGSIFVPESLYSVYVSATNWSVYSSRIVSVAT